MNIERINPNIKNSVDEIAKLEDFEKIKNPEDLLSFMKDNISYGFVGKDDAEVYTYDDEFNENMSKSYKLQTPEELLESKHGVCWDQVELERHWFSKNGYDYKTFFAWFAKEEKNNLPTHTFLAYNKDDKWYWFENSFEAERGIHEYDSLDELIGEMMTKHYEYAIKNRSATESDKGCLMQKEYKKVEYGSSPGEFVSQIIGIQK